MAPTNITEIFESAIFSLDVPGFNASFYYDLNDFTDFAEVPVDENATQLILVNGTRTRAPKYLNRPPMPMSNTAPTVDLLSFYTCPLIVAVGLMSNILAYLVFTRTRLRKVPSVPYLAAMAVVDSGALVTEFIASGLPQHKVYIITWSGICQYTTYFNYVFIFLCIWYPVALCVEKFISVYCPLRKAALCTPFRAKVVVISMAVMTGTCYYYVIYMTGPIPLGPVLFCREWDVFRSDFFVLMKLDSIFVSVLPSIVLIVLMILICGRGCEYYRISSAVEVSNRVGATRNSSIRAPIRVTNVIFPVALIVLTLKLPLSLMRLYVIVKQQPPTQVFLDLQPVFLYVSRFEWAIKLYIYLIFSPSFRRRTRSFLCSVRAKIKGRCRQDSSEDDEIEGLAVAPRINLAERQRGANARSCLMASDV